ncbi:MAG: hypothetical protein LBO65_04400 [Spirochaetaceae bacterium]|jgi:hypothetical protein|nr:hypothetical protein [Spirochaetaceae bacterium]
MNRYGQKIRGEFINPKIKRELDERARRGYTGKGMVFFALIVLLTLFSCGGDPPARGAEPPPRTAQAGPGAPTVPAAASNPEPVFDPSSITREEHDSTKLEIQQLIQRLNNIIRGRNYNAWVSYLDNSYLATISSPEYLEQVSRSTVLVRQKIVLNSAQDYFNHVVVPSRDNDRVDEIEFISRTRVKAYTINNAGNRLRLYDLERTGTGWKIIN